MVGSPYQTTENLISDLRFLQKLQPDMIGIGLYITHAQTPFANEKSGSARADTAASLNIAFVVSVCAFAVYDGAWHHSPARARAGAEGGRKRCDAEPFAVRVRKLYELYENKICTGEEAAQCRGCLEQRVKSAGYEIVTARGDVKR